MKPAQNHSGVCQRLSGFLVYYLFIYKLCTQCHVSKVMAFIEQSTSKQDPFSDTVQLMSQGNRAMQRVFFLRPMTVCLLQVTGVPRR